MYMSSARSSHRDSMDAGQAVKKPLSDLIPAARRTRSPSPSCCCRLVDVVDAAAVAFVPEPPQPPAPPTSADSFHADGTRVVTRSR